MRTLWPVSMKVSPVVVCADTWSSALSTVLRGKCALHSTFPRKPIYDGGECAEGSYGFQIALVARILLPNARIPAHPVLAVAEHDCLVLFDRRADGRSHDSSWPCAGSDRDVWITFLTDINVEVAQVCG